MHRTASAALVVISALAPAQTHLRNIDGENAGDRFGAAILRIRNFPFPPPFLSGACIQRSVLVSGSPGWSASTGRVELWDPAPPGGLRIAFADGDSPGDNFGAALAGPGGINGDGNPSDFVVGAPGTGGGRGRVRAYATSLFTLTGCYSLTTQWTVDGGPGDRLGHAVALIGDVNGDGFGDVVVGAPYGDHATAFGSYPDSGKVFVHSGSNGAVLRTHTASQADAHLGWAVAGVGDVSGDGIPDYAAGAPDLDVSGLADAGRVYVFSGATGSSITALLVSGTTAGMRLGKAIAGAGDVNQDGRSDYLLGAPDLDVVSGGFGVLNIGRFELRSGMDGSVIVAQNGPPNSLTGSALAGGTDLDVDGVPDFVVGAPGSASGPGRIEVWSGRTLAVRFRLDGPAYEGLGTSLCVSGTEFAGGGPGGLSATGRVRWYDSELTWTLTSSLSAYGSSLAALGDVDGDGADDLAIGRYQPSGVTYTGSTWHVRSGRTSQVIYEESDGATKGHTLCGLGDVNADGRPDLAVGDPGADTVTIRSGAAPATVLHTIQVTNAWMFGHALADAGDTDGDGAPDLLVGDPDQFYPIGIGVTGRVTLISGATGAVLRHHNGPSPGGKAGWSVAGLGDVDGDGRSDYAIGIPNFAVQGEQTGAVHVHSGLTGALLFAVVGQAGEPGHAGWSVCGPGDIDGDGFADVVVGEPEWGSTNRGRVRVIRGGTGSHPDLSTRTGSSAGDRLGHALTPLGDADRDGTPDFAMSRLSAAFGSGEVHAVSGATGQDLFLQPVSPPNSGPCPGASGEVLAGRRVAGPDGRCELLVGTPSLSVGSSWACLYGLPVARSLVLGSGCGVGYGATLPALAMTAPRLGRLATFTVGNVPLGSGPARLFISAPPAQSISIGSGCTVHVDPATMLHLVDISYVPTPPFGFPHGETTFFIPDVLSWAGVPLRFQAVVFHAGSPLGISLTNGIDAVIGF